MDSFSEFVEMAARFGWNLIPAFFILFPFYRFIEKQSRVKSFMGLENSRSLAQSLGSYTKGFEIFAVLLAVIAFLYEFGYEKHRDRVIRNAQLLAQLADLSYGEDDKLKNTSPAIKNIMVLLAREQVSMERISVPGVDLAEANLKGANLFHANLFRANLEGANLEGANLEGAVLINASLEGADFEDTILTGVILINANLINADFKYANLTGANLSGGNTNLIGANLTGANLSSARIAGAKSLTQEMLEDVTPSAPPLSLPEGLEWPFAQDENGEWARKE